MFGPHLYSVETGKTHFCPFSSTRTCSCSSAWQQVLSFPSSLHVCYTWSSQVEHDDDRLGLASSQYLHQVSVKWSDEGEEDDDADENGLNDGQPNGAMVVCQPTEHTTATVNRLVCKYVSINQNIREPPIKLNGTRGGRSTLLQLRPGDSGNVRRSVMVLPSGQTRSIVKLEPCRVKCESAHYDHHHFHWTPSGTIVRINICLSSSRIRCRASHCTSNNSSHNISSS